MGGYTAEGGALGEPWGARGSAGEPWSGLGRVHKQEKHPGEPGEALRNPLSAVDSMSVL